MKILLILCKAAMAATLYWLGFAEIFAPRPAEEQAEYPSGKFLFYAR